MDLSTVDPRRILQGPVAMLFGKALGGYGGAANYIRKSPVEKTFARAAATKASFDVTKTTADVNAPLNDDESLLFRITGSAQSLGSFVNFTRTAASTSRRCSPLPPTGWRSNDALRAEHNGARLVYRDGVPAIVISAYPQGVLRRTAGE
ncbi:MAG: hypothetical protein U1E25_12500 [Methylocystis sp.]